MVRKKRTYRLSEETLFLIEEAAKKYSVSRERAIEIIFKHWEDQNNKESDELLEAIKKVHLDINRIRAATNKIDQNTQMQKEFWNHYFVLNPSHEFISTAKTVRKEVIEAEGLVKERISNLRQKKLVREKGKKSI